ncbi:MAG: DoxX family protein [Gammaproteobacteria bacterium]|nr:DoxX family protein [Gammaproteobacteria bacterium]
MSTPAESTSSPSLIARVGALVWPVYEKLNLLAPVGVLALRLWVGWVFFRSGLTKIKSWDSTIYLFEYEYSTPFLSPEFAAYLGTAAELGLPVFLVLGLGGRAAALALFAFNIMAVISYPDLNAVGLRDHQVWGLMLLIPLLQGPGKLSVDTLLCRWFCKRPGPSA